MAFVTADTITDGQILLLSVAAKSRHNDEMLAECSYAMNMMDPVRRRIARCNCAIAINVEALTDETLVDLFAKHCECRPLNPDRTEEEHSHDCDLMMLFQIQLALYSCLPEEKHAARVCCVEEIMANQRL